MEDPILKKLHSKLLDLPIPPDVLGNYVPVRIVGKMAYVSGMLPIVDNALINYRGRIGQEIDVENGRRAAKVCVLNALGHLRKRLNNLNKIKGIVQLNGYINATGGFTEQAQVLDAASELLVDLWGEAGRHARTAVGVYDLPLGACIEIAMTVELR